MSRTMNRAIKAVVLCGALAVSTSAMAEWKPAGPINLMIGFKAGGGVDTQARLIAAELEKRKGWKIIPSNIPGKGAAVMARKLKSQPNDGLTIGMAVTETVGYNMLAAKKPGFSHKDFTYITTTSGSQMGLVMKTSAGFKSWNDVVAAAKGGKTFKFAAMTQKMADVAYLLEQKWGIKFNKILVRGGRAVLNGLNAGDMDMGFAAGIQAKQVKAGTMINLLSGEPQRLGVSPNAPTLIESGIPYAIGAKFLFFAPKGIPAEARAAYATLIGGFVKDKKTKVGDFIAKRFGGAKVSTGKELDDFIAKGIRDAKKLIDATS